MDPRHIRRSLLTGSAILAGGLIVLAPRVFAGDGPLILQPPSVGQVQVDPPAQKAAPAPQVIPPPLTKPNQAKPTQTKPTQVMMSVADCRRAVAHQPAPNVEYQPGIDARGRRVAPADLPGQDQTSSQITLPDVITLDVDIDFAKYTGAVATPGYYLEGSAGLVKFDIRTGKMTFNGQPLDNDASLEMQAQCRRVLSGR